MPMVNAAPLLKVIALLLPVLFSVVNVWLAVKLIAAAAGLLLTLYSVTPAASPAKTLAAVRLSRPESIFTAPDRFSALLSTSVFELSNVRPLLPVITEEIVLLAPLA